MSEKNELRVELEHIYIMSKPMSDDLRKQIEEILLIQAPIYGPILKGKEAVKQILELVSQREEAVRRETIEWIYAIGSREDYYNPAKSAELVDYLHGIINCKIGEPICSLHKFHNISDYLNQLTTPTKEGK